MTADMPAGVGRHWFRWFLRRVLCEFIFHDWEPIPDARCKCCGRWMNPPDDPHEPRLFSREVRRAAQLAVRAKAVEGDGRAGVGEGQ